MNDIRPSSNSVRRQSDRGTRVGVAFILMALMVFLIFVAISNFQVRSFSTVNACINNLRQIDGAEQQWALEHKKDSNAIPTWTDLSPYLKQPMVCPAGGTYTLHRVADPPTCSIPGHELPQETPFAPQLAFISFDVRRSVFSVRCFQIFIPH